MGSDGDGPLAVRAARRPGTDRRLAGPPHHDGGDGTALDGADGASGEPSSPAPRNRRVVSRLRGFRVSRARLVRASGAQRRRSYGMGHARSERLSRRTWLARIATQARRRPQTARFGTASACPQPRRPTRVCIPRRSSSRTNRHGSRVLLRLALSSSKVNRPGVGFESTAFVSARHPWSSRISIRETIRHRSSAIQTR